VQQQVLSSMTTVLIVQAIAASAIMSQVSDFPDGVTIDFTMINETAIRVDHFTTPFTETDGASAYMRDTSFTLTDSVAFCNPGEDIAVVTAAFEAVNQDPGSQNPTLDPLVPLAASSPASTVAGTYARPAVVTYDGEGYPLYCCTSSG
jgi:hypothetical protein